jgi:DNA replication protein DnaC
MTELHRRKDQRTTLRLQGMAGQLDTVMAQANPAHLASLPILYRLADLALEQRWHSALLQRWRQSALREKRPIAPCDFAPHASRQEQKTRLLALRHRDFVAAHRAGLAIGTPGTGNTCWATCLAEVACNAKSKGRLTTARDRSQQLMAAAADHAVLHQLQPSHAPDVLVVDELGDLSLGQQGAHLFCQVISGRHQHNAPVLTTNRPFAEGGKVVDSTTGATALADRLVHNSAVWLLGGSSDRRQRT